MTAATYLRRALLAPIIVPLLAVIPYLVMGVQIRNVVKDVGFVPVFLTCYLFISGIPYIWMLYTRRDDFRRLRGGQLEAALQALPLKMLPFFWKFWGVLTAFLLLTYTGIYPGVMVLVAGTFAVPILGYIYVAVTFAFLRGFQWLGLVEPTLDVAENNLH